jgi:hypothetical protein
MTSHKQPATTKQLAKMNSNSVTPVENVANANATKAPKKPTLSAKYSRFLSFAHWFLTKTDLNEETRKQLFQQMAMFGTVEEQTVFFEVFFSEIKDTNKVMRKMVAEAKKPPKAPKAPRAKKTKAAPAAQDELVAQLIADANGSEVASEAPAAAEAPAAKEKKPRAKKVKEVAPAEPAADATVAAAKEKKPRAKKVKEVAASVAASVAAPTDALVEPVAEAPADATEPAATDAATEPATEPAAAAAAAAKEKKPRAKKADAAEKPKKTKKTEAAPAVDDASEDVQTRVVTIGDKEYLIDSENNLYDTTFPHDQVGTFNPETGAIQA